MYKLINKLEEIIKNKHKFKVAIGFDGFIDKIYRPVNTLSSDDKVYYQTITSFGEKIISAANLSCDIDIDLESIQPGGNTPLFANGLGNLNIQTTSIAPIDGYEEIFNSYMSKNCKVISIGEPAVSIVLEFVDGKIMLGDTNSFKNINWLTIKKRTKNKIYEFLNDYQLLSFVNWSHFNNMSTIWEEIIKYLGRSNKKNIGQFLFVDLADTSSRSVKDIKEMLNFLKLFRKYFKVVLGINENEARDLASKIIKYESESLDKIGNFLINNNYLDEVIIHPTAEAYLYNDFEKIKVKVKKTINPVLTVGGGDHFNAGYCFARLNNFSSEEAVILGALTAKLFVTTGKSPSIENIIAYLRENNNEIQLI